MLAATTGRDAERDDDFIRVKEASVDSPENDYVMNRVDLFGPLLPEENTPEKSKHGIN